MGDNGNKIDALYVTLNCGQIITFIMLFAYCWVGDRTGVQSVKTEWRGTSVVICQ